MPPFDLTPGIKKLLGNWGSITGSVFERLPTQGLYSAIYNAQEQVGVAPGGFTFRDVNTLRSLATGWRNSIEAMAAEQNHTQLRGDLVALAPWSRGTYQRNIVPKWEVHYEYLRDTPGGIGRQWITVPIDETGVLSDVGSVRRLVREHAEEVTEGGGTPPLETDETFAGIGNILVIAV